MIPQAPGIADQHVSVACGLLPACRADYSMVTGNLAVPAHDGKAVADQGMKPVQDLEDTA